MNQLLDRRSAIVRHESELFNFFKGDMFSKFFQSNFEQYLTLKKIMSFQLIMVIKFREQMKDELIHFFQFQIQKNLSDKNASFQTKVEVLNILLKLFSVDYYFLFLFNRYDMAHGIPNLFQDTFDLLFNIFQNKYIQGTQVQAQEKTLRNLCFKILTTIVSQLQKLFSILLTQSTQSDYNKEQNVLLKL